GTRAKRGRIQHLPFAFASSRHTHRHVSDRNLEVLLTQSLLRPSRTALQNPHISSEGKTALSTFRTVHRQALRQTPDISDETGQCSSGTPQRKDIVLLRR